MENKKINADLLAKLILGLYSEEDRNKIISLLEASETITPELEEAIKEAFKKQAREMEDEIIEMEKEKTEIEKYAEDLRDEAGEMEAELDETSLTLKEDMSDLEGGLDEIKEASKEENNQSEIEALRNKLLNK